MFNRVRQFLGAISPSDKRRAAYSIAASAAATAFATEADATIVYSGIKNTVVTQSSTPKTIDLDGDGLTDISFLNTVFSGGNYQKASVFSPGKIVGFSAGPSNFKYVSALGALSLIDTTALANSPSFFGSMAYGTHNPNAQFNGNPTTAFIGLSFPISSLIHYGWIRVTVGNTAGTLTVDDWAYETTAGVGIKAGETASVPEMPPLGLLAAGSVGLLALRQWRHRRSPDRDMSGSDELVTA